MKVKFSDTICYGKPNHLFITTEETVFNTFAISRGIKELRRVLPVFDALIIPEKIYQQRTADLDLVIDFAHRLPTRNLIKYNLTKSELEQLISTEATILIYTDGSHIKGKEIPGFGAYLEMNGEIFTLSGKITPELLKEYDIPSQTQVSNPTAEFVAVAEVLKHFNFTQPVIFRLDYVGVEAWLTGKWKAKKNYIQKLKDFCLLHLKDLRYAFEYIPAHTGEYGNEMADLLAKGLV